MDMFCDNREIWKKIRSSSSNLFTVSRMRKRKFNRNSSIQRSTQSTSNVRGQPVQSDGDLENSHDDDVLLNNKNQNKTRSRRDRSRSKEANKHQ